jgi:hypothetical protein
MAEFNIGDKVRVARTEWEFRKDPVGQAGEIVGEWGAHLGCPQFVVKLPLAHGKEPEGAERDNPDFRNEWYFDASELEKVE